MDKVKDMVERYKEKADVFLKENIKAFITTVNGDWHYCYIVFVTDKYVYIQNASKDKLQKKERIFYVDIVKFEEYKER